MTPRRSLSSNAKPTCVRSADTSQAARIQTRQNADHPLAGYTYTNRQTLERARCGPQNVGKSCREAAQQTDRSQRKNSSSEDCGLDNGGREGPQQTGRSCGTGSSRRVRDFFSNGPII